MGKSDSAIEEVMSSLGEFGKYQRGQFYLHLCGGLMAGIHMLSLVTVAAVPEFTCNVPEGFTPLNECEYMNENKEPQACTSWTYDKTYFQSSRGIQWNMVCSRRWMRSVSQTIYMLGVFTGAVVLGSLADKYGRRIIFLISALGMLFFGVAVAFVPEYYTFLLFRFFLGIFGSAGAYITGFVLSMELIGSSKRARYGVIFQVFFAIGFMLVAAWGWLIESRFWLQIIYGLHALCFAFHWWLMDESPRWLWSQNRIPEALEIVQRALKKNNSPVVLNTEKYMMIQKSNSMLVRKKLNILDLFRNKNIRYRTLNVCLNWFANAIVYYGLSLSTDTLVGNPFLMMFISGVIELPSYVLVILLLNYIGRKTIISAAMVVGGLCCIIATYLDLVLDSSVLTIFFVMSGKFCIAASYAVIYNFSCELFPTVLRNTVLGLTSMCARFSGSLTPLIILLDTLNPNIPATMFGIVSIVAGLSVLLLPETLNKPIPETLEDIM